MSRSSSLQKGKGVLIESVNNQKIALNNFRNVLDEEPTARRGMVFAIGALEKQVLDLKVEKFSLKKLHQKLMQKAPSAFHKKSARGSIASPQQFPLVCSVFL